MKNLFRGRHKLAGPYAKMETKAVQAGESGGRVSMSDCITTPIAQTSAYSFRDTAQLIDFCEKRYVSHEYGRYGNPTTKVCEDKLIALEDAEDCLLSNGGQNTATTMILALVPAGGTLMTTSDGHARMSNFYNDFLPRSAITVVSVDQNKENLADAIREHQPTMLFTESPSIPYMRVVDIPQISKACQEAGTIMCVDATYATPINMKALDHGADLVVHSVSKYLAGHNDVFAGAIAGKRELVQKVRNLHAILGGVLDPHAAYLVTRGMKTLGARVSQQNRSALQLAQYLSCAPQVERVFYPGLPSHPDFEVAQKLMRGFGGSVSFVMRGGYDGSNGQDADIAFRRARTFADNLKIAYLTGAGSSFGGVETLVEVPSLTQDPASSTHSAGLVRLSVGIEDTVDLLADVAQALKKSSMWNVALSLIHI